MDLEPSVVVVTKYDDRFIIAPCSFISRQTIMVFSYPMDEYVFSTWCKFGTTTLCTNNFLKVFISRIRFTPMAVINGSCGAWRAVCVKINFITFHGFGATNSSKRRIFRATNFQSDTFPERRIFRATNSERRFLERRIFRATIFLSDEFSER